MSEKNSAPKYRDEQEDREALKFLYSLNESYRKTANDFEVISDGICLHASMVRMLINGYQPGKKIRKVLNWAPIAEVRSLNGRIPDGTHSLGAMQCVNCDRWFISNHPRRRRCFLCSPYRGQRRS